MDTQRNSLTSIQTAELIPYIRQHLPGSGMDDAAFAARAQADLKFPVSRYNIKNARQALGMQSELHAKAAKARAERELRAAQRALRQADKLRNSPQLFPPDAAPHLTPAYVQQQFLMIRNMLVDLAHNLERVSRLVHASAAVREEQ